MEYEGYGPLGPPGFASPGACMWVEKLLKDQSNSLILYPQVSLSGNGTEDDDIDASDQNDMKSNQKSAKTGDLCIEIKLGKKSEQSFHKSPELNQYPYELQP